MTERRIVSVRSISPLRLLRSTLYGKTIWQVVYPDGQVNVLFWHRKSDAVGQASIALPYVRKDMP